MMYFLLRYDRSSGQLLFMDSFRDSAQARDRRYAMEFAYAHELTIEILVLGAESEEALRRTHSRFFRTLPELAEDMKAELHAGDAALGLV